MWEINSFEFYMSLKKMKKRYIYINITISTVFLKYLELHVRSGNRGIGMEAKQINVVGFFFMILANTKD